MTKNKRSEIQKKVGEAKQKERGEMREYIWWARGARAHWKLSG